MSFGDESGWEVAREVVHGDAGFLTISQRFESAEGGPRLTRRTMWLSADGIAWDDVSLPSELNEQWLQALSTTAAGEYVILYGVNTDEPGMTTTEALISADGRTWEPIETGLPDSLQVMSLERGGPGWLLVGYRIESEASSALAAWYSSDGVAWEVVRELSEPGRWVTIIDAGVGEEGFVIAGTSTAGDSASHEYFTLASADGRSWVPSRSPFSPEDPQYRPDPVVAALGPDWVAALPTQEEAAEFWFSTNGIDWEPAATIPDVGPLSSWTPVFTEIDGRLYFSANGGAYPGGSPGTWSSADGSTWEPVDLGTDAHLGGIVAGQDVMVIAGTESIEGGTDQLGIWVRSLGSTAP